MTIYYRIDPFDKIITTNPCYLASNKSTELESNLTDLIIKSSRMALNDINSPLKILSAPPQGLYLKKVFYE